jgi:hypothetical protein
MRIKKDFERTARLTFEQHGLTDDRRCVSLFDFDTPDEIRSFVESTYTDLMSKKSGALGALKCKLKIQILDFPTNAQNTKQKKLEWSYWLYGCDVNVIQRVLDRL